MRHFAPTPEPHVQHPNPDHDTAIAADIGHAFHADYRPSYTEAAARDGWQRCTACFKVNGVA